MRCRECDHHEDEHGDAYLYDSWGCEHPWCECPGLDLGPLHTCAKPPPPPVQGCEIPPWLIGRYIRAVRKEMVADARPFMRYRQFRRVPLQ